MDSELFLALFSHIRADIYACLLMISEIQDVIVLKKVSEMFKQRYKITNVKKFSSDDTVIPSEEIKENVKVGEIEEKEDQRKTEQRDIERQYVFFLICRMKG